MGTSRALGTYRLEPLSVACLYNWVGVWRVPMSGETQHRILASSTCRSRRVRCSRPSKALRMRRRSRQAFKPFSRTHPTPSRMTLDSTTVWSVRPALASACSVGVSSGSRSLLTLLSEAERDALDAELEALLN